MHRSRCIGTKELEILLSDWLTLFGHSLSYEELDQYDRDVLNIENPQLIRYFMNGDALQPEHDNKYMRILKQYVEDRKRDYKANVPQL